MLSKMDQQRMMNEHDQMSMMYLKHAVEPGELIEYARGKASPSPLPDWVAICYVSNDAELDKLDKFTTDTQPGKTIVGVTSFPMFVKCRAQLVVKGNIDVILFKSFLQDQEMLEFCTMVQELEDIDDFKYILVMEKNMTSRSVDFNHLSKMILKSNGAFVLPHQMMSLLDPQSYTRKNRRHYQYDNTAYYVSSFDPSFDMESKSPLYYTVRSPVKFVRMRNSFAGTTSGYKSLVFADYYFDKPESIFFTLLQSEKCVFLTSPKAFYLEQEHPKVRVR